jgi:hypothetical protein
MRAVSGACKGQQSINGEAVNLLVSLELWGTFINDYDSIVAYFLTVLLQKPAPTKCPIPGIVVLSWY